MTHRTSLVAMALAMTVPVLETNAQGGTATYEVTWTSTWSRQTHPRDFPSRAHYSSLAGATHNGNHEFWTPGVLATAGVKSIAETGNTRTFQSEVRNAISAGNADQYLGYGSMGTPASMTVKFDVEAEFSQLTLLTMIAPSPDWFVGVHGVELLRADGWVDSMTIPALPYDSGTDSGITYASPNNPTVPPDPIARVSTSMGPFQGLPGAIGEFRIRRVNSTHVFGCGVNPAGSMEVSGNAALGNQVTFSLNDPTNSMPNGSATALVFSPFADAAYPCGSNIPGLGLGGGMGELLLGTPAIGFSGPQWNGSPANSATMIPNNTNLLGANVYVQGAIAGGGNAGLTDAVRLVIGQS